MQDRFLQREAPTPTGEQAAACECVTGAAGVLRPDVISQKHLPLQAYLIPAAYPKASCARPPFNAQYAL